MFCIFFISVCPCSICKLIGLQHRINKHDDGSSTCIHLKTIFGSNTGTGALVPMVATPNMLVYSDQSSDGTPMLWAIDKDTGEIIGEIEAPARSNYGMSSWTHDGHQYIMLQTSSKLTALALPGAQVESSAH